MDSASGPRCRCSRCDEEFQAVAAPRSYVIANPAAASPHPGGQMGWGLRIGLDDPMLAGRVAASPLQGADGMAVGWTFPQETEMAHGDASPAVDPPPMVEDGNVPAEDVQPRPRRGAGRLRGLTVLLLTSAGAAAGYHSWRFQVSAWLPPAPWTQYLDAATLTAGGAVAGLLLGWAWIRWAARTH